MEMKEDPENRTEDPKEEFSFLQETIKKEPVSKEKVIKRILQIAVTGLIFGVFACVGFYALAPWASSNFQGKADKVTIPEDEEDPQEEQLAEENEPEEAVLSAESYNELMKYLYQIAQEAEKCVVTVRAADADAVISSDASQMVNGVSGVIAADNSRELLIVASNAVCEGKEAWAVCFADGKSYPASLKKQDRSTGLAVFAVERNKMESATWEAVKVATLGNSSMVVRGNTAIALGNMFGYANGIGYGIISSTKYDVELADGGISILGTDIVTSDSGTGVLFNTNGEVTGLIMPDIWPGTEGAPANAYAISDLKPLIERLSNGEGVPYAGIYGVAVDEELSEKEGIPKGVYVRQVEADSPAMNAGIQNGDVLTQIGKTKITSIYVYQKALQELNVGDVVRISGKRRGSGGYVDIEYTVTVGSLE